MRSINIPDSLIFIYDVKVPRGQGIDFIVRDERNLQDMRRTAAKI